jgi:DNA-binding NtrC family response regulator
MRYSWPGNIVELENFVKRYLVMGDEAMPLSDPRYGEREEHTGSQPRHEATGWFYRDHEQSLKTLVRQLKGEAEIEEITKALRETRWNRHAAARRLKISYRGLLYKIQHYHLHPPGPLRPQ